MPSFLPPFLSDFHMAWMARSAFVTFIFSQAPLWVVVYHHNQQFIRPDKGTLRSRSPAVACHRSVRMLRCWDDGEQCHHVVVLSVNVSVSEQGRNRRSKQWEDKATDQLCMSPPYDCPVAVTSQNANACMHSKLIHQDLPSSRMRPRHFISVDMHLLALRSVYED